MSIGPQPGAGQTVGGSTLPSNPTPRQIFMKLSGGQEGFYVCFSAGSWILLEAASGAGTVTSVSGVSANGFSFSIANPTTTPAITLTTTVTGIPVGNGTAFSASNVTNDVQTKAAIVPNTAPSAGQILAGNAGGTAYAPVSMSGDATLASTGALTLASTISAAGPIGSATVAPIITFDAKGRLTTVTSATITPAVGSITGLGTGVATALGINVGSAGAFVTFNGNAGTPSALVGTNISGTAASLTAGTASAVAVGGITGLGTGVATALAVNIGTAGAPVVNGGALGTPSSGTGTNIANIPAANILAGSFGAGAYVISTSLQAATIELGNATDTTLSRVSAGVIAVEGVNVLASGATGVQTFLTTPSSANFFAAVTDETGSGAVVGGTQPQFTTGIGIGVAATTGNSIKATEGTAPAGAASNDLLYPDSTAHRWKVNNNNGGADTLAVFTDNLSVFASGGTIAPATINAHTLGGAISGGANQINNVQIGATNPLAGSFTTVTTSVSSTTQGESLIVTNPNAASNTTKAAVIDLQTADTGGTLKTVAQIVAHPDTNVNSNDGALEFYTRTGNVAPVTRMKIDSAGVVYMPSLATSSAATTGTVCWTTGTGLLNVDTTTTCLLSSSKYKENSAPLDKGLQAVLALKPVRYYLKKEFNKTGLGEQVGFFAEDVAEIDDRLVSFEEDGSPHAVRYQQMAALLASAIQEQHARYQMLESRFNTLWSRVNT